MRCLVALALFCDDYFGPKHAKLLLELTISSMACFDFCGTIKVWVHGLSRFQFKTSTY